MRPKIYIFVNFDILKKHLKFKRTIYNSAKSSLRIVVLIYRYGLTYFFHFWFIFSFITNYSYLDLYLVFSIYNEFQMTKIYFSFSMKIL